MDDIVVQAMSKFLTLKTENEIAECLQEMENHLVSKGYTPESPEIEPIREYVTDIMMNKHPLFKVEFDLPFPTKHE